MQEFARKTGLQVYLSDPAIAQWPVSASVEGIPLVEGIKRILDGFSYVIYRIADTLGIIVLSTQPDPARTGNKMGSTGFLRASLTAAPDKISPPTAQGPNIAPLIHASDQEVPQSLDEFQPITMEQGASDPMAVVRQEVDPATQLAKEQEHQEMLLQRALDALKSEHKHLHVEAIHQLQGMKDPRATQALVDIALSGEAKDPKVQVQAVETLSRHAADLEFRDEASITALKQLAEASDTRVAEIARQALRDMQQYQEQNAVQ